MIRFHTLFFIVSSYSDSDSVSALRLPCGAFAKRPFIVSTLYRIFLNNAARCIVSLFSRQNCTPASCRSHISYPFTDPTMIPASKYFWKKGYITRRGRLETMIVAYFSSSASWALAAVLCISDIMPDSGLF